jgi:hypothetical protein
VASKGQRRKATSFSTSMKMPPRPTIATGPKTGSWKIPSAISTAPLICLATARPRSVLRALARGALQQGGEARAHRRRFRHVETARRRSRSCGDVGAEDLHHHRESDAPGAATADARRRRLPPHPARCRRPPSRRFASASLGVDAGRRHLPQRHRPRRHAGKRLAEAPHRVQRHHRPRRVLEHQEAVRLVARTISGGAITDSAQSRSGKSSATAFICARIFGATVREPPTWVKKPRQAE